MIGFILVIVVCTVSLIRQWRPTSSAAYIDISRAAGEHLGREVGKSLPSGGRILVLQSRADEIAGIIADSELEGFREGLSQVLSSSVMRDAVVIVEDQIEGGDGFDERLGDTHGGASFSQAVKKHSGLDAVVSFVGVPRDLRSGSLNRDSPVYALVYGYSEDWRGPMRAGVLGGVLVRKMIVENSGQSGARSAEQALFNMYDYFTPQSYE